jgi:hypothetical protein
LTQNASFQQPTDQTFGKRSDLLKGSQGFKEENRNFRKI